MSSPLGRNKSQGKGGHKNGYTGFSATEDTANAFKIQPPPGPIAPAPLRRFQKREADPPDLAALAAAAALRIQRKQQTQQQPHPNLATITT